MAILIPLVRAALKKAALTIIVSGFAAMPSYAQTQTEASSQSRQFSTQTGTLVLEAQNLIGANQHQSALSILDRALALSELTPYERSVIHQMQGSTYYELNDYNRAINAFDKALLEGGLSPKETQPLNLQLAQLMIANGQYAQGAERLEKLLKQSGERSEKYCKLLLQAWVQAEKYDKALPWARRIFAAANPKTREHFDPLNFLYNKLGRAAEQANIVMEMIERWPDDPDLWTAWGSLFIAAGQDEDAFEVTRLQYLSGALTNEDELSKIVQYYSYYDMPFQAAQILEKEINAGRIGKSANTLEQLSSLWRQAREYERAIPVLIEATKLSGKAELYAQLGEALYNEGQCARAETAFITAVDKGYSAGKAWMLVGTCRYEDVQRQNKLSCEMSAEDIAAAPISKGRAATVSAFKNVPAQSSQYRDAEKWISFVKAERLTFDKQCEVKEQIRTDECFKDIKRAYDNQFIDGTLTFGDPSCEEYVSAYDKEHRSLDAG